MTDKLRAAEQPAQEPMHPEIKKMYEDYFDKCFRESSAQQRPWVGLTDDEIDELACAMVKGNKSVNWLCRAIEAKLRSKNNG